MSPLNNLPGAVRGGFVSESVAKALCDGIGGEQKRGISTVLFRRSGAIRAFATDLDNRRRRGPRREGGRGPGTARPGTGVRPAVAAAVCGCCAYPRSRPWAGG